MAEPTRDISVEDFIESFDRRYPACILETLLRDRTTGRNIIWADSEYEALGDGYMGDDEITVENQALRHLWWLAHPGPDWAESRERYDIGTRARPTGGADMDAQAGMPAGLFERSVGLGDAWEVADASQAVDRLHVMRLAPREADRVRRAEAKSSAEGGRLPRGTR